MPEASLSRRSAALLLAVALHVLLAVLVASKMAPTMAEPPVMQVTLLQLPPPPRAAPPPRAKPARATTPTTAAPRPLAVRPTTARLAPPAADWRVRPSEPAAEGVRAGLRARVGCRSADLLALTTAERAACDDDLARNVENAPNYAVISPKLKKVFDRTFECAKGDVWCEYRTGKAPYPGLAAPMRKNKDPSWD